MNNKERIFKAARGEMVDKIPLLMHPDDENRGLMDLIPRRNMDVAKSLLHIN